MFESGYYPPGAEHDPNAPWNQSDPEEKEVDICVSTTLSKSLTVYTTDYEIHEEYESDIDDEGHSYCNRWTEVDFSNTDFKTIYTEQNHTIPQLLQILVEVADEKIASLTTEIGDLRKPHKLIPELIKWKSIKEEAKGWVEDEFEVCQE